MMSFLDGFFGRGQTICVFITSGQMPDMHILSESTLTRFSRVSPAIVKSSFLIQDKPGALLLDIPSLAALISEHVKGIWP